PNVALSGFPSDDRGCRGSGGRADVNTPLGGALRARSSPPVPRFPAEDPAVRSGPAAVRSWCSPPFRHLGLGASEAAAINDQGRREGDRSAKRRLSGDSFRITPKWQMSICEIGRGGIILMPCRGPSSCSARRSFGCSAGGCPADESALGSRPATWTRFLTEASPPAPPPTRRARIARE